MWASCLVYCCVWQEKRQSYIIILNIFPELLVLWKWCIFGRSNIIGIFSLIREIKGDLWDHLAVYVPTCSLGKEYTCNNRRTLGLGVFYVVSVVSDTQYVAKESRQLLLLRTSCYNIPLKFQCFCAGSVIIRIWTYGPRDKQMPCWGHSLCKRDRIKY
jgi:hypothetical protein